MLIAFIAAVAFIALSHGVFNDAGFVMRMDTVVDRWFVPLRTRAWSRFFSVVTFFGSVYGVGLVSLAIAILTHWNLGVIEFGITAVGGSAVVAQLVKVFTARMRPDHLPWRSRELEYSYPSGHSAAALTLYGMLALFVILFGTVPAAIFGAIYLLLILAVGASRIALSVHYASDVLGGYLLGIALLALAVGIFG